MPVYEVVRQLTPGTVIRPDNGHFKFAVPLTIKGRDRAAILDESEHLWLYGYVKYRDFMGTGETHTTGFVTMSLLLKDKPGEWFMFVYSSDTPAGYEYRT